MKESEILVFRKIILCTKWMNQKMIHSDISPARKATGQF